MKKIISLTFLALACVSTSANAWFFFFFIPGGAANKVGDSLSGAEGENCVKDTAKVGDVLTLASGNSAKIKSLSGASSRCQSKELPIRALLEFSYDFSSKAGIEIPDSYVPKQLTDTQRAAGLLVSAQNAAKKSTFVVSSRKRDSKTDMAAVARTISDSLRKLLEDSKTANEEELTVNGMKALRFELTGKSKGVFGRTDTYMVTVLEGDGELLAIIASAPVDDYAVEKDALKQLSLGVKGLKGVEVATTASPPSAAPSSNSNPSPVPVANATATPASPTSAPSAAEADHSQPASSIGAPAVVVAAPAPPPSGVATGSADGTANKLRELNKLFREGILNQEEYERKKKELLKAL